MDRTFATQIGTASEPDLTALDSADVSAILAQLGLSGDEPQLIEVTDLRDEAALEGSYAQPCGCRRAPLPAGV